MRDYYDLVVIGGGIGGSALATVMARAGRSVLVLEKSEIFEDLLPTEERIVLGRFRDYWGPPSTVARLVFQVVPDARQRLVDLESGAIVTFVVRNV